MPFLLRSEEHTSELQSPCNLVCRFFLDRKSTRLNSSHLVISYAVFCLKKKKPDETRVARRADALCAAVLAALDAPRSGWAGARYCSPDILIAATGVDAIICFF